MPCTLPACMLRTHRWPHARRWQVPGVCSAARRLPPCIHSIASISSGPCARGGSSTLFLWHSMLSTQSSSGSLMEWHTQNGSGSTAASCQVPVVAAVQATPGEQCQAGALCGGGRSCAGAWPPARLLASPCQAATRRPAVQWGGGSLGVRLSARRTPGGTRVSERAPTCLASTVHQEAPETFDHPAQPNFQPCNITWLQSHTFACLLPEPPRSRTYSP